MLHMFLGRTVIVSRCLASGIIVSAVWDRQHNSKPDVRAVRRLDRLGAFTHKATNPDKLYLSERWEAVAANASSLIDAANSAKNGYVRVA